MKTSNYLLSPIQVCAGLLCASALCTTVTAQDAASGGMLAGIPFALSFADATPDKVLSHPPGLTGLAPTEYLLPPGDPQFAELLGGFVTEINAFSSGKDWILSDEDGVFNPGPTGWQALTFSVTMDTASTYADLVGPDAVGSSIFSYVFDGSALPEAYVDELEIAVSAAEFDTVGKELDAHDTYSMAYAMGIGSVFYPIEYTFYFSISGKAIDNNWYEPEWFLGEPSAATILETTWDGSSWSTPSPYLTFEELGLQADDDIDALAIDRIGAERDLFSTVRKQGADTIKIAVHNPGGIEIFNYRLLNGTSVAERLGAASGIGAPDFDSLCAYDPFGEVESASSLMGVPELTPPGDPRLNASLFRNTSTTCVAITTGLPFKKGDTIEMWITFEYVGGGSSMTRIKRTRRSSGKRNSKPGAPVTVKFDLPVDPSELIALSLTTISFPKRGFAPVTSHTMRLTIDDD